jgi:Nucleoside-diphosphate-sugar epimerases
MPQGVLLQQSAAPAASPFGCKVAVFGGDGFIGSYFVEVLIGLGCEVTVFGHTRHGAGGNLAHLEGRFRRVLGEFSDQKAVASALLGQDVAAHFILASTPVGSWGAPLQTIEADLKPSVLFFEQCARLGVRKVIFASSGGSLYGPQPGDILEEATASPFNPHGIIKLCEEHFLNYFKEHSGLASDCYRIGNAYGPRQPLGRPQGVIGAWIGRILDGLPIEIYGDGETVRDYVHAADAARLMAYSLRDLAASDTFNIGTGRGTSVLELLSLFRNVHPQPFEYRLHPRRALDNTRAVLPSDKLLRNFPGFVFRGLEDGVRECFAWARDQRRP